jgi:hypothetical protein
LHHRSPPALSANSCRRPRRWRWQRQWQRHAAPALHAHTDRNGNVCCNGYADKHLVADQHTVIDSNGHANIDADRHANIGAFQHAYFNANGHADIDANANVACAVRCNNIEHWCGARGRTHVAV